jgi:hypothetical protein
MGATACGSSGTLGRGKIGMGFPKFTRTVSGRPAIGSMIGGDPDAESEALRRLGYSVSLSLREWDTGSRVMVEVCAVATALRGHVFRVVLKAAWPRRRGHGTRGVSEPSPSLRLGVQGWKHYSTEAVL